MDLSLRSGRLDRPHTNLLQGLLAGGFGLDGQRAQSQEGGGGTQTSSRRSSSGSFSGVVFLQGFNSKGKPGNPNFPKRFSGTPCSEKGIGKGKPGLVSGHDQKGRARVERLEKTGSESLFCGRSRAVTWSVPQRDRQQGMNLEPLPSFRRRKRNETCSAVSSEIMDFEQATTKKSRGSMAKALEIASSTETLNAARNSLVSNFWAANTVAVKKSRREDVLRLAFKIQGSTDIFPLSKTLVEGAAAALKAAGVTSGALYLNELKMIHVEKGFEVEQWLQRVFVLCNKSLTRNRGPVKRAPEVKLEDLPTKVWTRSGDSSLAVPLAAFAYAWGVAWMLREVELSKLR